MKRAVILLALLTALLVTPAVSKSFIINNRTGSDILIANGSTGDVGVGLSEPAAQLDIISDSAEKAFQVEANSDDTWYIDQNGNLVSSQGPLVATDTNIGETAFSDTGVSYLTSGRGSASDYDIVLDPSGSGRVNVSSNLNLRDNNVTNFFDSRCQKTEVVDGVNPDGTYQCVNVSEEVRVYNLSETLEAGNVANQTINMSDEDIINIGKLDFDNGRPELVNPSQGTIKLRGNGGSTDEIFEVLEDSSAHTVLQVGNGQIGSAVRNPVDNEDIIRFNQSGGSNVEIPNGYLNISNDNDLKLNSGNIEFRNEGANDFVFSYEEGSDRLTLEERYSSTSEALRIMSNGSVQVRSSNLNLGDDEIINLDRIDSADSTNLALARDGTDELVLDSGNINFTGNDLDNVGGTVSANTGAVRLANDVFIDARNSGDDGDIQVIGTDSSNNVQIGGNGNIANLQLLNSQLNITQSDAVEIGYGTTKLYEETFYLSDGYGNDGVNISSSDGIRLDAGGPSSDGNLEFSTVGIQEESGELELTGGDTRSVGGNLIMDKNNITNLTAIKDYYEDQCSELRAVQGLNPNGTYDCTEKILEEETEYLNQTLDAGNWAGDTSIYMNGSQIYDVGSGRSNFTSDGGLDMGGDIEMNGLNVHNTGNSLALDFDSDKINVRGGLDIENDSKLRDDQELEFGTGTDYDLRYDSGSGNLVLRNGSTQVLVADSSENLEVPNGDVDIQGGVIEDTTDQNVEFGSSDRLLIGGGNSGTIKVDGSGDGTLNLETDTGSDDLTVATEAIQLSGNSNPSGRIKTSGQPVSVYDGTGSENITVFYENGSVYLPNGDLNMNENDITNFFHANCAAGEVVERVYENGTYSCLDIDAAGAATQNLSEVLDAGNKAFDDDINMTDQNIRLVNSLETNESGNFIDGDESSFAIIDSGSDSEIDVQAPLEMNGNGIVSDDSQEFNISDLQAVKDGFEVENGDVTFNNSNGLQFINSKSYDGADSTDGRIYMDYSNNELVLNGRNPDLNLRLTDSNEYIFGEGNNDGNVFEVNSEGGNGEGSIEVGNSGSSVPIEMNDNNISNVNMLRINDNSDDPDEQLLEVGDQSYLTDVDEDNTLGIQGQQNSDVATIELGSSGPQITGQDSGDTAFSGNIEADGNNLTEVDEIAGDSEAVEMQNDVNMTENDVNDANAVNFGGGASGERLVKTSGGDLCLGDQC